MLDRIVYNNILEVLKDALLIQPKTYQEKKDINLTQIVISEAAKVAANKPPIR